jgi:metallo-beta-lactamase family protein
MKKVSPRAATQPKATFLGAARTVTGSMHLVEFGGSRLLLDCGVTVGRREEAHTRNGSFPFDPASIDAVIVSHAHVDHCGNLPSLVRQGFGGPIYCTPATRDLLAVMLADSARVHEADAVVAAVVHGPAPERAAAYTRGDAERTVARCITARYGEAFTPVDGCEARFHDAGHILGSAITTMAFSRGSRTYRLSFTGDLGRRGLPFVREPSLVPAADLLISESTYGGRLHDTPQAMAARMTDLVVATAARGGRVLVPAFSLGRTQIVLHYLRRWMREGLVPQLPLYVDSPLAAQVARIHERHHDLLAEPDDARPPVHYVDSAEEHRELATEKGPCIVVASGGMCDGGRIMAHLKHHLDDPRCSVALVSYQAPHTPGAQLLELRPTVRFHGRNWNKWAEVVQINGFSGHADHDDFLALLGPSAPDTGRVCLVHGEPPQAEALARDLRERGFARVDMPERLEAALVA